MDLKLLHITDLHIGDKDNPDDFLREGFYRDYVDKLFGVINPKIGDIDYLMISGDYINAIAHDTPIEQRFEHASKVVEYIQQKFGISKNKTFSCIGNHDYILAEEATGNNEKARQHYNKFVPSFTAECISNFENFAFLYKDENNYILSLDSTYNSKGKKNQELLKLKR